MWRKAGCVALIVMLVALVAVLAIKGKDGGFNFSIKSGKKDSEEKLSNFEAAKIQDLVINVEATGTTEPVTDIDVKSEATGRIIEFHVEEGDRVAKGDTICKLDQSNQQLVVKSNEIQVERARVALEEAKKATSPSQRSSLEATVANLEANLRNAEETLTNADSAYQRVEDMHTKGYATDQELETVRQQLVAAEGQRDSVQAALDDARLQLETYEETSDKSSIEQARLAYEAARVSLQEARKQLGDSVIVSPIDGIILEKPLDIGDSVVSINSAFSGGNTIVRVADLRKIQVRTSVDEIDIGKITVGQRATTNVDAFPEREFQGTVTNVFPQGVTTGTGVISFVVMVEVDNTEGLLLGNMTASVKIEAQKLKDVLTVPLAATRAGEEPNVSIVHVLKEGEDEFDEKAETEEREVRLGDTNYYDIVILSGLKAGEMVKIRGFAPTIQFE